MDYIDKDCELCKGEGGEFIDKVWKPCRCELLNEINEYLTPFYKDSEYLKGLTFDNIIGKNVILTGSKECTKSVIKSYLVYAQYKLYPDHKYTHIIIDPEEMMADYLSKEKVLQKLLIEMDFLVIWLLYSPKHNGYYGEQILSLIERRELKMKTTWIYSPIHWKNREFIAKYSKDLSDFFISENKWVFLNSSNIWNKYTREVK
jgi:hypothetical protein